MLNTNIMTTTRKNCYCHTCKKWYHYLGINSHRAMHRRRKEDCEITYTHGDTYKFSFSKPLLGKDELVAKD